MPAMIRMLATISRSPIASPSNSAAPTAVIAGAESCRLAATNPTSILIQDLATNVEADSDDSLDRILWGPQD